MLVRPMTRHFKNEIQLFIIYLDTENGIHFYTFGLVLLNNNSSKHMLSDHSILTMMQLS